MRRKNLDELDYLIYLLRELLGRGPTNKRIVDMACDASASGWLTNCINTASGEQKLPCETIGDVVAAGNGTQ